MKVIRRALGILALLTAAVSLAAAQDPAGRATSDQSSSPIEWKSYKVPNSRISFAMPKPPTVSRLDSSCGKAVGEVYYAYSGQTAYSFSWKTKSSGPVSPRCVGEEDFGIDAYTKRLAAVRSDNAVESKVKLGNLMGVQFKTDTPAVVERRLIVWADERLIEITVARRPDAEPASEEKFISSFSMNDAPAQEIGKGSDRTLGDAGEFSKEPVAPAGVSEALAILFKPRAGYTELAREKKTVGSIVLKVAFLANGSIGEIETIKGLENGLTESAIASTRNIVFLPARANGVPVTVVKNMEFSFSIY